MRVAHSQPLGLTRHLWEKNLAGSSADAEGLAHRHIGAAPHSGARPLTYLNDLELRRD